MMPALLLAFIVTVASPSALAQAPPPAQAPVEKPPAPAQGQAAKPEPPPPVAPYNYDPAGRRDPFVSLIGGVVDAKPTGVRPSGVPGLLIGEITVRGVIRDRNGFIALVQGSDEKTHMLRAGDRLADGSVKSITADRVVFSQDVNDPLSLVKQREVSKGVRQGEGRGGAPGI